MSKNLFETYNVNGRTYTDNLGINAMISIPKKQYIEYEQQKEEIERLNNIINELEKWVVESIEKYTEDYLDWKYDRNVYLAGSKKLQNVLDKLQELKGSDKE